MGARHFAIGAETTVGTAVTPDHFYEALTESVQIEREYESLEVMRNYSVLDVVENKNIVRGDVEILANYDEIGLLYQHLLGSAFTTTGTPNTHTFPSNFGASTNGIPATDRIGLGLTCEFRRDGSLVWTYAGCKLTGLTHEFSTEQASRMTVSMLGMSEATSSGATTASFPTFLPMKPSEVTVTFGSTAIPATRVLLTVANPLDEPFTLGSSSLVEEPDRSEALKVTLTVDAIFDNFTDLYNSFDGSTDVDVQIKAAETTSSVTYNLNKCRVIQATPHNSGRERLTVSYELESYRDTDSTENLQVVLENNDSTP